MAIVNKNEDGKSLTIEVNNGDLSALNDIVRKWNFKDKESALRFAIAVLSLTQNGSLYQGKNDGNKVVLQPTEALINKEE